MTSTRTSTRAWLKQLLPRMDALGALLFQVAGQELSVASARAIVARIQEAFGGRLPEPRELLGIHGLDQLPSEQQLHQIAERWRPYRTLAVMYLQESEYERGNVRS